MNFYYTITHVETLFRQSKPRLFNQNCIIFVLFATRGWMFNINLGCSFFYIFKLSLFMNFICYLIALYNLSRWFKGQQNQNCSHSIVNTKTPILWYYCKIHVTFHFGKNPNWLRSFFYPGNGLFKVFQFFWPELNLQNSKAVLSWNKVKVGLLNLPTA